MSRYTKDIQNIFRTMKPPYPGFIVDIVEYPNQLILRVYQDNVDSFSQGEKVNLAEYLFQLRDALRSVGAKVEVERVGIQPPNFTPRRTGS